MNASQPSPQQCKRILFCTDFSPTADCAFDFALDAAIHRPGCEVILLHVIPEPEAQFWKTYIYEVEGIDAKARRDVDAKIAENYLPRTPEGVTLRVEIRIGRVSDEILQFARDNQVDLLVIGRHGHSGLGERLFGAVTDRIVRKAPCPVLVVPNLT